MNVPMMRELLISFQSACESFNTYLVTDQKKKKNRDERREREQKRYSTKCLEKGRTAEYITEGNENFTECNYWTCSLTIQNTDSSIINLYKIGM